MNVELKLLRLIRDNPGIRRDNLDTLINEVGRKEYYSAALHRLIKSGQIERSDSGVRPSNGGNNFYCYYIAKEKDDATKQLDEIVRKIISLGKGASHE